MTIGFDIQLPDVLAFTKHYVATNKNLRRTWNVLTWIGPVLFIGLVLLQTKPGTDAFLGGIVGAVLLSVFYVLLLLLARRRTPLRLAKQVFSNPENSNLIGYREMTFSEDEILLKSDKIDLKMAWNTIIKVGDMDTHFLLYTGSNQAYIIPKRKITLQDVETLNVLFKSHNLL